MKKLLCFLISLFTISLATATTIFLPVTNGSALVAPFQAKVTLRNTTTGPLQTNTTYSIQCTIRNNNTIAAQLLYALNSVKTAGNAYINNIQIFPVFNVPINPVNQYNFPNIFLIHGVSIAAGVNNSTLTFTDQCTLCTVALVIQDCFATTS